MSRKHKQAGSSLVEVVTAASMSVMVLFAVVLALISGMQSWARGEGRITAEMGSQQAVRMLSAELRQAMAVTVEAGGNRISYRLPLKDDEGDYQIPITWDGVNRRIYFQSEGEKGDIWMGPVGSERIVCRDVVLEDSKGLQEPAAYRLFTPGEGSITRQLTLMVVTESYCSRGEPIHSRIRETIYLRNIPILTQ